LSYIVEKTFSPWDEKCNSITVELSTPKNTTFKLKTTTTTTNAKFNFAKY